jgi:hypothetical protein
MNIASASISRSAVAALPGGLQDSKRSKHSDRLFLIAVLLETLGKTIGDLALWIEQEDAVNSGF